jgi:predicted ATPase
MALQSGARIGPYEILGALGAGGMGEVYRARDSRLGREVALKLIPQSGPTQIAVDRFRREAQAASALNHPNVVTIYEIGETTEDRFIAMELVVGCTLRQLVGELSVEAVRTVGAQVAQALSAAHAAGICHRDIKPENVMLRPDGYVKVLDFGLARLIGNSLSVADAETDVQTRVHSLLGTLRYMSPEQARGEQAGSAADVFALGLVLYELVTGAHPFARESSLATLHAVASESPRSPASLNPSLLEAFDRLIMRMLERDPLLRPTANEVAVELANLEHGHAGRGVTVRDLPTRRSVGRDREAMELRAAYDATTAGRGLLLCVAGEPGIGKTTVVQDFLNELASENARCWLARGRCSERLAGTEAYLPVLEALDSLRQGSDRESFTRLARALAPTWYEYLLPCTGNLESRDPHLEVKAASPERFKRELATLLLEMSRQRPIVLFLDDLHWSDVSTVDLLSFLATRFDGIRILVVVTYRPADLLLAKHPFALLRLELQGRGLCREIPLPFLTLRDVASYLALEFPANLFPPEFASLIYRKTEGNPLFMVDLLRDLSARAIIARQHKRWSLVESLPSVEKEMPESVRSLIKRMVARLDKEDHDLLTVASVQGYQFDTAVLTRALSWDPSDVEERLDHLEHTYGLITTVGEQELPNGSVTLVYRFVHVLYQNALYSLLRPARRTAFSAAVANALISVHGEKAPGIATGLALLFEVARDLSRAVEHLLFATQNAVKLFADEEAISLARRGLGLLDRLPANACHDRYRLQLQLLLGASLTARKGFADPEAEQIYAQARELGYKVGDSAEIFPALHGLYRYFFNKADLPAACETVERMVELARLLKDPTLMLIAEGAFGAPLVQLGDFATALRHLETSLNFYDPKNYGAHPQLEIYGADPRMTMLAWASKALWHLGQPDRAVERTMAGLTLARSLNHPFSLAYALVLAAWLHIYGRDVEAVVRYSDEAIALSMEQGFGLWLIGATMFRQWAFAQNGQAKEAAEAMKTTLAVYRAGGGVLNAPHFMAITAEACCLAGNPGDALRLVEEGLAVVEATGERCWEADLHRMRGDLLLTMNGDHHAEQCLQRAVDVAHRLGARVLELRALCSLACLHRSENRAAHSSTRLHEVYSSFTEGFDTPDLRYARLLLNELDSTDVDESLSP